MSNFGPLGTIFAGVANAAVAAENQVAKQADAEFKIYQDLSRNGLASGMDSAFRNLTDMSYTMKDLGEGAKLVKENSAIFAALGGGAEEGLAQFTQISKSIKTSGIQDEFVRMGKSIPEINAGILNYVKYQQQSGHAMQQDAAEAARSAQAYMLEQDKLTKLTGLSADEQQATRDQAIASEQYAAHQFLLNEALQKAKGTAAEADIRRRLANEDALLMDAKTKGPKALANMAMYLSGNVTTKAAQGAQMMYGDLNKNLSKYSPGEVLNQVHAADKQWVKDNANLAIAGASNKLFDTNYAENLKGATRATIDYTKAEEMALLKQQSQVLGEDKTTKAYTDMIQHERETSLNLQKTIHLAVPMLSDALGAVAAKSASITGEFTKLIDAITGGPSSATTGAPTGPAQPMTQAGLSGLGLKIKEGDVQQEGAKIDPRLLAMATKLQNTPMTPGFSVFTGFNDKFHIEKAPGSGHTQGRAMDFTLQRPPSKQEGESIVAMLKGLGAGLVIDEYNNASLQSTGGHIHAEVPSAAQGGILSGPQGGYESSLGDAESRITLPSGKSIPAKINNGLSDNHIKMLEEELGKLDSMINIMQKQNDISTRMLRKYN